MKINAKLLLAAVLATGCLGATAASAQNQPAPDQHQEQNANPDTHRDMHSDTHRGLHRDMHRHGSWHRHCMMRWHHHHRVRVCR